MKKLTFLIVFNLIWGLLSYSQVNVEQKSLTGKSEKELKIEEQSSRGTAAVNLTIIGEKSPCYEDNEFVYSISLTGGWTYGLRWEVWVTNGTITLVDGIVNMTPTTHWVHSNGEPDRTYEFTIDWDDYGGDIGTIEAYIEYFNVVPGITNYRTTFFYANISKPATPEYVNVSNSTPYIGQTITCSTNEVEGADDYIWTHTGNGALIEAGTTASYTPASSGPHTIIVSAVNSCGTSYEAYTGIQVQQQYPPLSVSINGPTSGYTNTDYVWVASVNGGKANYDYVWYSSINGIYYNTIWATNYNTSSLSHAVLKQLPLIYDLYLKLVVTDDLGNQAVAYFKTTNRGSGPPTKSTSILESSGLNVNQYDEIVLNDFEFNTSDCSVYPNPTSSLINIPYECFKVYDNITIYNSKGILVLNQEIVSDKIDFSTFADGIYFITFTNQVDNSKKIIKIIKN